MRNTETKSNHRGYADIEVLEFLKGREYDEVAQSYISGLRPSKIRISENGFVTLDSCPWRVTVMMDQGNSDLIWKITQEVEVSLFGDIQNGYDLQKRLKNEEKTEK